MITVTLTDEPIDAREHVDQIRSNDAGAFVLFEGSTRRSAADGPVVGLEYEAYDHVAVTVMRTLSQRAVDEHAAISVVCVHRTGYVPVGECSIVVGVTSAHRAAAFNACQWLVDAVKSEVPIWKKEIFEDGTKRWIGLSDGRQN